MRLWIAALVCASLMGWAAPAGAVDGAGLGSAGALSVNAHSEAPRPQVAYLKDGALWARPLPSGEPRLLADGKEGAISHPRWSPSGRWLMVRQGDGFRFFHVEQGITPEPIPGRGAAWSPTADEIAYLDADGHLRIADPLGRTSRVVAEPGVRGAVGNPFWSPDGRWIAYATTQRGGPNDPSENIIWRVRAEGGQRDRGQPEQVLRIQMDHPFCLNLAGWAPDGGAVLYWPIPLCSGSLLADGTALMAVPSSGGQPKTVVERMLAHPDFLAPSPVDGRIAVVEGGARMTWSNKRIVLIDPATGERRTLSPEGMAAISPAWSGDGQEVAFAAMPDLGLEAGGGEAAHVGLMKRQIWVADTLAHPLVSGGGFRNETPRWTSSGWLFARLDEGSRASLWLAVPDGLRKVTSLDPPPDVWFGYYGWLDWGSRFAVHPG